MTDKVNNDYFCWLCNTYFGEEYFSSHYRLVSAVFDCDFISIVENDCNREYDGLALRNEYEALYPEFEGQVMLHERVNVLEVMIGLAKRMIFFGGREVSDWLKEMMTNLGFGEDTTSDDVYDLYGGDDYVYNTLDIFVNREYDPDGRGGLFPLDGTHANQREVALWYQMQAYIIERM